MRLYGGELLQAVGGRILERYLREGGATGVLRVDGETDPSRLGGVDLVYMRAGRTVRAKVKADPYFGTDPTKIADQQRSFYRTPTNCYAFETIAHHLTREPGWMFNSLADELFYYFIALDQTEEEVSALLEESDEIFFSSLSVERDDLHVIPMPELKQWFDNNHERYTPRPVKIGDHSGWYRIMPVDDIDQAVPGVVAKGAVFSRVSHR
jgi:hypothetical protein